MSCDGVVGRSTNAEEAREGKRNGGNLNEKEGSVTKGRGKRGEKGCLKGGGPLPSNA